MSVKLIAVDMDGTFLDDLKRYNRPRFLAQYARMKQQGIRFAVASGNQYYQLYSFFPEIAHEIAFVADNGAWVVCEGVDLFNGEFTAQEFTTAVEHLLTLPDIEIIVSGKQWGYTLKSYDPAFKRMAASYYHRLKEVDNFSHIDDVLFKFALELPDDILAETMIALGTALDGIVVPVTSGHGSIDLIIPGLHKANGLRRVQARWGIEDHEVVAFGDGGNDIEMLTQAGYGFAMQNAPENIRAIARYQAGNNNHQAVLDVIDKILNNEAPFQ